MNEIQAINVLTELANKCVNEGFFKNINESGNVYVALSILANRFAPVEGQDQVDDSNVEEPDTTSED
jgi:hypothetical protein